LIYSLQWKHNPHPPDLHLSLVQDLSRAMGQRGQPGAARGAATLGYARDRLVGHAGHGAGARRL
jgi:hypothetical protein